MALRVPNYFLIAILIGLTTYKTRIVLGIPGIVSHFVRVWILFSKLNKEIDLLEGY
jgi:hypothetical protein